MVERVLKAPRQLHGVDDIDFLLAEVEPTDRVILDFNEIQFVRPVGIVELLAALERLSTILEDPQVTWLLPKNDVGTYLRQAGVFDAIRELGTFTDEQPEISIPLRQIIRPMVPCTHFRSDSDVDTLAAEMEERFMTEFVGYGGLLEPCYLIFSELATNVIAHADSDGGYVLAQQYNYRQGAKVDIAVADCGIGIRNSLLKNPSIQLGDSDCEAIVQALAEGISSLKNSYRGYGLSHVSDRVQVAEDRRMTIRSGQGIIVLRGDGSIGKRKTQVVYPGTIVNVEIPCGA